jgi:tetratricopeptide (TPR) repeat protein
MAFALSMTAAARAEPTRDPAAAEALFNEAKALLKRGDWGAACAKYRASMELDPAVATLLKIASCYEREGKLAAAWYDYQRALKLNRERTDQSAQRRKALEAYATKALAALEPRVP